VWGERGVTPAVWVRFQPEKGGDAQK